MKRLLAVWIGALFLVACSDVDRTNFEEVIDHYAGTEWKSKQPGDFVAFQSATYKQLPQKVVILSAACTKKEGLYKREFLVSTMKQNSDQEWVFVEKPVDMQVIKYPFSKQELLELKQIEKSMLQGLPKECL